MGQMMPTPQQLGAQPRMSMQQRIVKGARRMQDIFPKWLTQYSIVVYILALAVVSFMYSSYSLPWYYMLSGVISVFVFFLLGSTYTMRTSADKMHKTKRFERTVFLYAFIPRVLFTFLLYEIFQTNYGDPFGFENMDAHYYHDQSLIFADAIRNGNFVSVWKKTTETIDMSDLGYSSYLGLIYALTENSIIVARLLKCLLSSITVLLIYRLVKRNFGEQTGRVASIFCALWPNFWYYCAVHLKETEMVFLAVLFVEQADQMLRSRQFTAWKVIPVLLIAAAMFTVRTPLALVALLSLVFSLVMSSSKVVNWGKRIIVGVLAGALIVVVAGNVIQEQANVLVEQVQEGKVDENLKWRAERDNGNSFAKYAGASVFAPMIFTLPFPSMVRPFEGQDVQQIVNGGNFVKNIMSGFTILAIIMLLMSGKWREHLLPLSFMLGYLVVLTMSSFAQSERFHQPVMPFEFMFAAYGLSLAVTKKKYKRWFTYWCGLMFIACIVWNWYKMAGRGLA